MNGKHANIFGKRLIHIPYRQVFQPAQHTLYTLFDRTTINQQIKQLPVIPELRLFQGG
ncbi:hypothetical protein D3C75_1302670 [compost metagenome]